MTAPENGAGAGPGRTTGSIPGTTGADANGTDTNGTDTTGTDTTGTNATGTNATGTDTGSTGTTGAGATGGATNGGPTSGAGATVATVAADVRLDGPWTHRDVAANGARFHIAEMGDGPLVLLLHGFPQFWWTWRHQLPALAEVGYRAVAMDLRGVGAATVRRAVTTPPTWRSTSPAWCARSVSRTPRSSGTTSAATSPGRRR